MNEIIDHLAEEVEELRKEPTDIFELADILNNVLHVAERNNWSLKTIEEAMITKLNMRFDVEYTKEKIDKFIEKLNTETIVGRCLNIDRMGLDNLARYARSTVYPVTFLNTETFTPNLLIEGNDYLIPTKNIPFEYLDKYFLMLLESAVPSNLVNLNYNNIIREIKPNLLYEIISYINACFVKIESRAESVKNIICGEKIARTLEKLYPNKIDKVSDNNKYHFGRLWNADLFVTDKISPNSLFCLAAPEILGILPLRENEEIGMFIDCPILIAKAIIPNEAMVPTCL